MEKDIVHVLKSAGAVHVGFLNRNEAQFGEWIQPWLEKGYHGDMSWMGRNQSIRRDPCSIMEEGRSIIAMAFPYRTRIPERWSEEQLISSYAWGDDYHNVIKKRLKKSIQELETEISGFKARAFVDSAPLPEKIIAAACGIGWIGRNSLLISPEWGSFLFLAEIVCNLDLESTPPIDDHCGSCDLCIHACPNQAIQENRTIDSTRCISYLTIEKQGSFSDEERQRIGCHLFGCDCCQLVCPWNENNKELQDTPYTCDSKWLNISIRELVDLSQDQFDQLKIKSPLKRLKLEGIRRNAKAILANGPLPDKWD